MIRNHRINKDAAMCFSMMRFQPFRCYIILCAMLGLLCRSGFGQEVLFYQDVVYGQADEQDLLLDIRLSPQPGLQKGIILVHGGGWSSGQKEDMSFLYETLNDAGIACFSINYRLAPQYGWPACIDDTLTAIQWVKSHAAGYGVDPMRIAILGYSAGGHLACMAATQVSKEEQLAAVIGFAAPTDHEADSERRGGLSPSMQQLLHREKVIDEDARRLLRQISPIHYIHPDLPPFLLIHGTQDQSVLYSQSVTLQATLKEKGVPCELITLDGAAHKIAEWPQYDPAYQNKMIDWLSHTFQGTRKCEPEVRLVKVDLSGRGDFTSVQAAIDAIDEENSRFVTVIIEPGIYKELIRIPASKPFIRLQGRDAAKTILTNNMSARMIGPDGNEIGTFRTPTATVEAADFAAENITFANSAGDVGQALAIAVLGDRTIFRNCRFLGWQDTIYDQAGRHYYENCHIEGHCDFIFGSGTAFFEKCRIHCLQGSYITAASTPQTQAYGYVFSNCMISGEPAEAKTYLGRPWRDYASVIFLNTQMDNVIRPEGWHNWGKPERERTVRYGEYNSTGPGGNPAARVGWSRQLTPEEVKLITADKVLGGTDGWNPLVQDQ